MINRIGLWAAAVSTGAFAFSAAALAADMPVKAPPPVVVAVYNWTGLYIGIQGGYAWGDTRHEQQVFAADTGDFRIKGGLVGGTVGYNYQVNSIVLGIEADYSWSGIKGDAGPFVVGTFGCGLAPRGCVTEVEHFGTVRGRLGVVANQFLIFASGGWAYGRVHAFLDGVSGQPPFGYNGSGYRSGWAAGGGVEYGFTPNLSAKLEYLRVDLGKLTYGQPGMVACNLGSCATATAEFNVIRAGLNWRFGGPVVARY
jgi:outer membrane immunogenic protein